ncbi:MAG: hypothetical protein ACRDX8_07760 [Acidimicrobiales bacterium]
MVARIDLAWIWQMLALDSEAWHHDPDAFHKDPSTKTLPQRPFHKDKARSLRRAAAGWAVLAVTPRNLRENAGADLAKAIRQRLGQRPAGQGAGRR